MENFVLIDSNAIIHRAYHALPKSMAKGGMLTNAVYGFTTTLIKVLEDLKPTYIAASFDLAAPTFRHEAYEQYKATRVKADQELYDQIPMVRELLENLNITVFEKEGFEADDCLGTVVEKLKNNKEVTVYPVSGDKDIFQLINGNVKVYNLRHGLSEALIVDREFIKKEYNLDPEDFIDLKALAGDPSDNIPGVPGIGPKTATTLLQSFDSLKNLYDKIEAVIPAETGIQKELDSGSPDRQAQGLSGIEGKLTVRNDKIEVAAKELGIKPRIVRLLIENRDQAFLSRRLATICRDVPLDFSLENLKWGDYDREKLRSFFERMGFRSIIKRFSGEAEEPKTKEAKKQKEEDKQLKLL